MLRVQKYMTCFFLALLCFVPGCASSQTSKSSIDTSEVPRGTRPYIYGCGVMWGGWYDLKDSEANAWDEKVFDMIKAMGGTNVPANIVWADIEKVRGTYDWSRVDAQINAAHERGLQMFAYTGLTPDWALPPEAPKDKPGIGYRFPPDPKYTADFEKFFEAVTRRYKGKVKYYGFWNEPNGCSWINDGCSNGHMAHTYVPWLKRWYAAMKKGDPKCVLALGGLDYNAGVTEGWKYIEDVYANGGGDSFDAVAIHPYGEPMHWKAIHDTYACLVKHGDGHKKLWLNEYGWNTQDEETKAKRLVEVLNELKKPEYHMVFQANYLVLTDLNKDGHDYGLCKGNPAQLSIEPRASYEAFKNFDKKFPPNADVAPKVVQPTLPPPPPSPDRENLLRNPNFEMDFTDAPKEYQDAEPRRLKAPEWDLWGGNLWTRSGGDGHLNHTPFGAQSVGTDWGRIRNAVYQRVRSTKEHEYQFSAYTRVDSPQKGDFIKRKVGIDPTGGIDPTSENVIWSNFSNVQSTWEEQTVKAKAKGEAITVFAYAETIQPNGFQWFHVDTAKLVDLTK